MDEPDWVSECRHVVWTVLDKFERMQAVLEMQFLLPKSDFIRLLGEVWTNVDNAEDYWPHVAMLLHDTDPKLRRKLMNDEDLEAFDRLPEWLTIYRGDAPDADNTFMPAWSLDRKIAVKFAYTESPEDPVVYQAVVNKSEVYAHFDTSEQEIFFDPAFAETFNIEEIEHLEPKDAKTTKNIEFIKAVQRYGVMSVLVNNETGLIHAMQGMEHWRRYLRVIWRQAEMLTRLGLHMQAGLRYRLFDRLVTDERAEKLLDKPVLQVG